mmetsp:Transcript_13574/g.20252  ORF Transcript_13574/g.20252 Transcript_13574/m.20252 type:complete len:395 (-) Transcript_13574:1014-2198(-)|eukprot:CAMPEP_0197324706 /NCGR_PEP_ID=MMETSP0891-20130614/71256_1 /TAXON_ID=44058 ORGANISM="Aureoumbra lagunensis, Strain CCMP1510" /NCGR_SAMPLE_ID=MMETSP0891 /ASSEMBLY_ACC=CAM_ASM_000534 /LENGTH=394 /DNA_ID=CAMNT_0042817559 /DNA_START=129 /DNA_END=1313 /DNA_ORIENTATION=+
MLAFKGAEAVASDSTYESITVDEQAELRELHKDVATMMDLCSAYISKQQAQRDYYTKKQRKSIESIYSNFRYHMDGHRLQPGEMVDDIALLNSLEYLSELERSLEARASRLMGRSLLCGADSIENLIKGTKKSIVMVYHYLDINCKHFIHSLDHRYWQARGVMKDFLEVYRMGPHSNPFIFPDSEPIHYAKHPVDQTRFQPAPSEMEPFTERSHVSDKATVYMNAKQRERYRVGFDAKGYLVQADMTGYSQLLTIANAKYVLTPDGDFFIGHLDALNTHRWASSLRGSFFHPSFLLPGAKVVAAGRIAVKDGVVVQFDNSSGHFQPSPESVNAIWSFLKAKRAQLADFLVISVFDHRLGTGFDYRITNPMNHSGTFKYQPRGRKLKFVGMGATP